MKYSVKENTNNNKFEALDDNNNVIGSVDFELRDNTSLAITHTIVKPEFEGQGIAGSLNKEVLEFAKKKQYKVVPICSYTKAYIERHPEYKDLV